MLNDVWHKSTGQMQRRRVLLTCWYGGALSAVGRGHRRRRGSGSTCAEAKDAVARAVAVGANGWGVVEGGGTGGGVGAEGGGAGGVLGAGADVAVLLTVHASCAPHLSRATEKKIKKINERKENKRTNENK